MGKYDDMNSEIAKSGHGRKTNQKMKPYLVYQYLMRYSDENHAVSAEDIVAYL